MYEIIEHGHHVTFSRGDLTLLGLLAIWSLAWKTVALWKAARHSQLAWFVVLAIVNSAGILEIIYLTFFQAKSRTSKK